MGVVRRAEETFVSELEQLRRNLVACGGIQRRKDGEGFKGLKSRPLDDPAEKVVCVTSGVSFLGAAIVNELLLHGYSVRIVVDSPEDINKLEETTRRSSNVSVVAAKLTDVNGLTEAFDGCRGVFHTSSAIDPAGLSGYTKIMSQVEAKSSECVMEACARAPTVRNCVVTSSLVACIWRDQEQAAASQASPAAVNHDCWSSLQLCQDKKLWYALGKLKAEKAAWRIAEESGLNLATICSALVTGPNFHRQNSTATMAYLKGAREMYANGFLATVDVISLAKAHVSVYDELSQNNASAGRFLCFDRVITTEEEAEKLAMAVGVPAAGIVQTESPIASRLSNKKLCNLMGRSVQRCYSENRFA